VNYVYTTRAHFTLTVIQTLSLVPSRQTIYNSKRPLSFSSLTNCTCLKLEICVITGEV